MFTRGDYIFIRESNGGTKRLLKGTLLVFLPTEEQLPL